MSKDNYTTALETLYRFCQPPSKQPSLSTMQQLCAIFSHPTFPTIHVAGTNGKGSVCTKLAYSLSKGGYRTGLYTSPHISSFRERIRIGTAYISEEETSYLLNKIYKMIHKHEIKPTFFEITTLLAFLYFQQHNIDIAIIETGIGGRYDATNIITPLVSVITAIGFDHTEVLGSSLDAIAQEKAGIIKKAVPVVLGPDAQRKPIIEKAKELHAPIYQSTQRYADFDEENTDIATLTLKILAPTFPLSTEALEYGLHTTPPCRFESHFFHDHTIIFDVSHNAHGFTKLIERLKRAYPHLNYRFILGFSKGKDIASCALLLQHEAHSIHLISSPHPRLAKATELHPFFTQAPCPIHIETDIPSGIHHALQLAQKNQELIIIAGSFFIMNEAKKAIHLPTTEDNVLA